MKFRTHCQENILKNIRGCDSNTCYNAHGSFSHARSTMLQVQSKTIFRHGFVHSCHRFGCLNALCHSLLDFAHQILLLHAEGHSRIYFVSPLCQLKQIMEFLGDTK